ncbi:MAG TPA: hypoxanthine phosphoribosyltransferase [Patescibacteria group bacterium]|nr:hypoxanthine phosphoribosyltransferase [Patescibacteria group bacterium]
MPAAPRLKILIPHAAIRRRVRAIARRISLDFRGQPVHLIGILSGACIFLADLARELELEVSIDFMAVASYGRSGKSSGQVRLIQDLGSSIEGLNVIIVEDVLDTGLTLDYLRRTLLARRPKSLRSVVLLDKRSRRLAPEVHPDYAGFEIPDQFVVGYGLDWAGRFRHLRDVCVLLPASRAGRRARSATIP